MTPADDEEVIRRLVKAARQCLPTINNNWFRRDLEAAIAYARPLGPEADDMSAWLRKTRHQPPRTGEPLLARDIHYGMPFIAHWSGIDEDYLTFVDGWCAIPFDFWMPIPNFAASAT